jgi:hypothetical protein
MQALCVKFVAISLLIVERNMDRDRSFPLQALAFRGTGGEPPRLRLRGLTCPAIPAGVKSLLLQSTLCFYILAPFWD